MIIFFILVILTCDLGVILWGEIRCWSLLRVKGLRKIFFKAEGVESDIGLLKRIFSYVSNWKKFSFLKSPFDTMLTPVFFIFDFQGTLGLYLPRHCKRICKVWSWASQVDQEVWGCECYYQEGSKLDIIYTLNAECKEILRPNMLHFNCSDILLTLNFFSWYLHSLLR